MLYGTQENSKSRDYEAWVYVEGLILEDKKKKLESTKRRFEKKI